MSLASRATRSDRLRRQHSFAIGSRDAADSKSGAVAAGGISPGNRDQRGLSFAGETPGAAILVERLCRHGVDTVFGLPGLQLDWIFDALYDKQDSIKVIHTRHEQATAYMAFGFAQATGRPGVCLVVPGPGVLNATAALATAYACNAPVLCTTGQIPSAHIGGGLGFLHEVPEQLGALASVSKWQARIEAGKDTPG